MKLKQKALVLRRQLSSGHLAVDSPQLAAGIRYILHLFMGFFMSCAVILGQCSPFGVAAVGQAGSSLEGILVTLGASAGYLVAFGLERGIRYMAACVLVFTTAYVCQELPLAQKSWFMPSITALFTFFAGFLETMELGNTPFVYLPLCTEALLSFGCTCFFHDALRPDARTSPAAETRHSLSLVIFIACLLTALARVEIASLLSIGRLLSLLCLLTAACKGGALSGAAAGATLGIAMDMAAGGTPYYVSAYAFSGLVAGIFSRQKRYRLVIAACLADACAVLMTWHIAGQLSTLYEAFAAAVIFLLLPEHFLNYCGTYLRPVQLSSSESGLRRYTARRLVGISEAFGALYTTVDGLLNTAEQDEDLSRIYDAASQRVCIRCKYRSRCWTGQYMETLNVFNDLTPVIESRGLVQSEDLAPHFLKKCPKSDELVGAINSELRARAIRARYRQSVEETRTAAYSQYADLSLLLQEVSDELQSAYGPDILSQRRLQRYLAGLGIDADISVFRDRTGRLHLLLDSPRLPELVRDSLYLDKLSNVVGVRLCRPRSGNEGAGRLTLLEAEPLSACVGIASVCKQGEPVSGDRGTYFKTDRGVLCVLLSDGMGSGEDAAQESVTVVSILERFLRSGVDPALAMHMLNSMMLLRNRKAWGFATVDLMCIDLFTGETTFYKYGAAPSYIRTGHSIRRVHSETLAAGLTVGADARPDVVRMRLRPGCLAVVASDGVVAGTEDIWLRALLEQSSGEDPTALARETLQGALTRYGCNDDMTVLCVRLDTRA